MSKEKKINNHDDVEDARCIIGLSELHPMTTETKDEVVDRARGYDTTRQPSRVWQAEYERSTGEVRSLRRLDTGFVPLWSRRKNRSL